MEAKDQIEQPITASRDDTPDFDPSRMIGIIKRKALIKELAAAYHAECLACCQKLLQFQRKWEEQQKQQQQQQQHQQYIKRKAPEEPAKQITKPSKRSKKGHRNQ